MVSVLVDRGFDPRPGQIKVHKIGICCFSAKRTLLRSKNKDILVRSRDNVSERRDMSICILLFH